MFSVVQVSTKQSRSGIPPFLDQTNYCVYAWSKLIKKDWWNTETWHRKLRQLNLPDFPACVHVCVCVCVCVCKMSNGFPKHCPWRIQKLGWKRVKDLTECNQYVGKLVEKRNRWKMGLLNVFEKIIFNGSISLITSPPEVKINWDKSRANALDLSSMSQHPPHPTPHYLPPHMESNVWVLFCAIVIFNYFIEPTENF